MKPRQEADIVPGKKIMAVAIAAVLITAVGVLSAWGIADCRAAALGPPAAPTELERMPRIPETIYNLELALFDRPAPALVRRQRQEQRLRRYGWVSREQGVVHIPIQQAMELYVRGMRLPTAPDPARAPAREMPPPAGSLQRPGEEERER